MAPSAIKNNIPRILVRYQVNMKPSPVKPEIGKAAAAVAPAKIAFIRIDLRILHF